MAYPQDRNSERLLGELSANVASLGREIHQNRELSNERHLQNREDRERDSDKLDQLLGLKPMVEAHDAWIKGPGAEIARMVSEAKGAGKLTKLIYTVCGLLGGGVLMKAAITVLAALPK